MRSDRYKTLVTHLFANDVVVRCQDRILYSYGCHILDYINYYLSCCEENKRADQKKALLSNIIDYINRVRRYSYS